MKVNLIDKLCIDQYLTELYSKILGKIPEQHLMHNQYLQTRSTYVTEIFSFRELCSKAVQNSL